MGRHAEIDIRWADGEHKFRLALGQLRELQEKTGVGPQELLRRLTSGTWRIDDLRETIRLGLIGGGLVPVEAIKLVMRYVDDRPLAESVPVAQAVMMAVLFMVPDDPLGEAERREEKEEATGSSSPRSTEPVQ